MNYDRLVLGIEPIPQPKREIDIYEIELNYEAKQIVDEELSWDEDNEDGDWDAIN